MKPHQLDITALIGGLLFALSGFAIVADQVWAELDVTAVVGAGVGVLGVFLIVLLITRQLKAESEAPETTSNES